MNKKKVLIVGGTGFIGYHAVKEFLSEGYKVTVLALPPMPKKGDMPDGVRVELADINMLSDESVTDLIRGNYIVVFAAGADDRTVPPRPASKFFYKYNVAATRRFIRLAKEAGAGRAIVLSSYFLYFERHWHELHLAQHHPYIASRKLQAQEAIEAGGKDIDVMILELPYIFGASPGRKPLWYPLVKYLKNSSTIYYTHGGTNVVSVETVAQAIVGAAKHGRDSHHYTIGSENMTWSMMLNGLMAAMNVDKKIVILPNWLVRVGLFFLYAWHVLHGRESGLNPLYLADLQTRNTFFNPASSRTALKFGKSDMSKAFIDTVRACRQ